MMIFLASNPLEGEKGQRRRVRKRKVFDERNKTFMRKGFRGRGFEDEKSKSKNRGTLRYEDKKKNE